MKITKSKLKRIIKEELQNVLSERETEEEYRHRIEGEAVDLFCGDRPEDFEGERDRLRCEEHAEYLITIINTDFPDKIWTAEELADTINHYHGDDA